MHVDDILKKLVGDNENDKKKKKLSLVGSLASYAKSKRVFARTNENRNTFELLDEIERNLLGDLKEYKKGD